MEFNNFIFQAWKVMEYNIIDPGKSCKIKVWYVGRLGTEDEKARIMYKDEEE